MTVPCYTTPEQSKNLMLHGLDPKTADMHYTPLETGEGYHLFPAFNFDEMVDSEDIDYLPCWSTQRMLDLLPYNIADDYWLTIGKDWYGGQTGYEIFYELFDNEDKKFCGTVPALNLNEAAYEMLTWIIMNHYELNKI